jgi:hypothetical protein
MPFVCDVYAPFLCMQGSAQTNGSFDTPSDKTNVIVVVCSQALGNWNSMIRQQQEWLFQTTTRMQFQTTTSMISQHINQHHQHISQ